MSACDISFELLVDYRFGEGEALQAEQLEEHMFGCERCARRVHSLEQLGAGVRELVASGAVATGVTADLLGQIAAHGLQLREYLIASGQSVPCTAAPDDDFVVVRLALGPSAIAATRVDVETEVHLLHSGERRQLVRADVVVDRDRGELQYLFPGDYVRALPRSRWVMHAVLSGATGDERLGPFVMDHTPWSERPSPA